MTALICGSMAYDTIMVFQDQFKNHILPDQVHILNVSFLVPEMRRNYGGCAGNIAFNLHMLGGDGLPMSTVGADFAPYADWLDRYGGRISSEWFFSKALQIYQEAPEIYAAADRLLISTTDGHVVCLGEDSPR